MESKTPYGTVKVIETEAIYAALSEAVNRVAQQKPAPSVGLTGGSTPKAWYRWAAEAESAGGPQTFHPAVREQLVWSCSDERLVPLADAESNFGNASRMLLDAINIPPARRLPWPVEAEPLDGAATFLRDWEARFDANAAFDLCFLGMGDDCHTASLFPGSPLISEETGALMAAVEVPTKGWRYTLTPKGLAACGEIIITVTGSGKQAALAEVFKGDFDPNKKPVQLLKHSAEKVTWLVDPAAAGDLF